jgi:diaminohydroxyphosphoribosylaminopyrimidine deaminase/5-amino-6-(5-phosphoribosylamino)uracil reductase
LRDQVDAIMIGVGTALADDPLLTCRLPGGGRDPLRVVVDALLELPPTARMLTQASSAKTLVITTEDADAMREEALLAAGALVWRLPQVNGWIDLAALWRRLAEWPVQALLLEGGATLAAAALEQNLIDRLQLYLAPKLLGGTGKSLFAGLCPARMADARLLRDLHCRRCGEDLVVEGELQACLPD